MCAPRAPSSAGRPLPAARGSHSGTGPSQEPRDRNAAGANPAPSPSPPITPSCLPNALQRCAAMAVRPSACLSQMSSKLPSFPQFPPPLTVTVSELGKLHCPQLVCHKSSHTFPHSNTRAGHHHASRTVPKGRITSIFLFTRSISVYTWICC